MHIDASSVANVQLVEEERRAWKWQLYYLISLDVEYISSYVQYNQMKETAETMRYTA